MTQAPRRSVNRTKLTSMRTTPLIFDRAKRRADHEGVAMNTVLEELLEGYGLGLIDLPKVTKTYAQKATVPTTDVAATSTAA
jgi:hypothetical protein